MPLGVEMLKYPLRAVRAWPPVNHAVTTTCRAVIERLGWSPGPLARFLPRAGVVEAALPNGELLRMWSRADDDVTPQVYWKGWSGHEPDTARLFYQQALTARTTVDIGAHVGYFALLAAHANPAGQVYAFEPHPIVYERLAVNARLNGLRNLSCEPTAVGSATGSAQFFHGKRISSSSSLSQAFMESIVPASRLVSSVVNVVSLDEFVEDRGIAHVDLVKIDTETTEGEVFQGMTTTLARDEPVVFCEILEQPAADAIEEILEPLGYRYFSLTGEGPREREHIRPMLPWRNYCFVPASGPAPSEGLQA